MPISQNLHTKSVPGKRPHAKNCYISTGTEVLIHRKLLDLSLYISLSGFFSIPFKYDEIELRKDGCFNVRIDKSWGVMTIDGYEFIPVKYSEKIADNFKDLIVQDSISGGLGILNEHGKECIPTLYEHLQLTDNQNIIFFGYGGCESDCNNFF